MRADLAAEEEVPGDPDLARAMAKAKEAMADQCRWSLLVPLEPGENGFGMAGWRTARAGGGASATIRVKAY